MEPCGPSPKWLPLRPLESATKKALCKRPAAGETDRGDSLPHQDSSSRKMDPGLKRDRQVDYIFSAGGRGNRRIAMAHRVGSDSGFPFLSEKAPHGTPAGARGIARNSRCLDHGRIAP